MLSYFNQCSRVIIIMDYELISLFMYCIIITLYIGSLVLFNKIGLISLIIDACYKIIEIIKIVCHAIFCMQWCSRTIKQFVVNDMGYKYKPF
jgi:hypothetical protein